jgi:hypothetical protein
MGADGDWSGLQGVKEPGGIGLVHQLLNLSRREPGDLVGPAGGQRSKVFARKADAQRFLNETETAKARGTWTDPALGRVLFRDWLGEWWATTTNLRPKSRDRDELLLRRLALPSFGAVPLAAIGQRDVRAWVAQLNARGLAPATVQKAYQLLGKVMGAAVDPSLSASGEAATW